MSKQTKKSVESDNESFPMDGYFDAPALRDYLQNLFNKHVPYQIPVFVVDDNGVLGTFIGMREICVFGGSLFEKIKETDGEILTITQCSNSSPEMFVRWKLEK